MHRLDLGLYSHPKEFFGGMEFEPMLTPREKSPLPKMSPGEDRTNDAVDSEPKHYQLSYFGPRSMSVDCLTVKRLNIQVTVSVPKTCISDRQIHLNI